MKKLSLPLLVLVLLTVVAGTLWGQATGDLPAPSTLFSASADVTAIVFGILTSILTAFVSPGITNLLKRWGVVDPEKAAAANMTVAFSIALVGWWLQVNVLKIPGLSGDLMTWIGLTGMGGGLGQAGRSWWNNRVPSPSEVVNEATATNKAIDDAAGGVKGLGKYGGGE